MAIVLARRRPFRKVWRAIHRKNLCEGDLVAAVKACGALGDLESGRVIHGAARRGGDLSSIFLSTALIDMYCKCRAMVDARDVFDAMDHRDVVAWNALIAGYVENGESKLALDLFSGLERPSSRSFVAAAMACVALAGGEVGRDVGEMELEREIFVGNALVNAYAKCGSLIDARRVFDGMACHDVVSWNSLILGCVENRELGIAVELFSVAMFRDARTAVAALMACGGLAAAGKHDFDRGFLLEKTMEIHSRYGSDGDLFLENTLVDAYAKCGSMIDSRKVFDCMKLHSVVSWNALMLGYVENGEEKLALELFEMIRHESSILPDARTLVAAAMACAGLSAIEQARELDGKMVKMFCLEKASSVRDQAQSLGLESDLFVANALIDSFAKCGSMDDARKVFRDLKHPDIVSWTSLLQGYAEDGGGELGLEVFETMQQSSGCVPNSRAFVAVLIACSRLAAEEPGTIVDGTLVKLSSLEKAFDLHSRAARHLRDLDIFVSNALVNLYSNCGFVLGSRAVFERMEAHDVVSWNSLLVGYVDNGESSLALELFESLSLDPNPRTFVAALAACADLAAREDGEIVAGRLVKLKSLDVGMALHSRARTCPWWESNADSFLASSLFHMYSKCGCLEDARRVFDCGQCLDRGTVTWRHLVQAYVDGGENELALEIFTHAKMDAGALVAGIVACGNLVNFECGRWIQSEMYRLGYEKITEVVTSIVNFHSKCGGRMVNARYIFDQASNLDSVLWNSLICGYSREGEIQASFELLRMMREQGFHPDGVTFLSMLNACCHAGLVDKGEDLFRVMWQECGIVPSVQHYTCMVDLLGRANQLDKALQLVEDMPHKPDRVTWMALLSASRNWKDAGVGTAAFEELMTRDMEGAAAYSLMADLVSN